MTKLFTEGVQKLQAMTWNGRQVKVFIFGNYAFLCTLYGLSGPTAKFPCLWCLCSKENMQTQRYARPKMSARTLDTIKTQSKSYKANGSKKELAPEYQNAIHPPLWSVPVARVCPPYLHILLGVVKRHHDLLEDECNKVDVMIGEEKAKEQATEPVINATLYDEYVMKLRRANMISDDLAKNKQEYAFEEKDRELAPEDRQALLQHIEQTIAIQQQTIDKLSQEAKLHKLSGPVASNLDRVLQENNIKLQAFHSRSFTGNHCHKYLQESTISSITNSIVSVTKSLTNSRKIVDSAKVTAHKFQQLNIKYSKVHASISHSHFVPKSEMGDLQATIDSYLQEYRSHYPDKIFPKLHMLEDHVVPWIKETGFGMGLMGEQGGESAHKVFKALMRTYGGMPDPVKRLNSIIKRHMLSTDPRITRHVIAPKRRKLKEKVE